MSVKVVVWDGYLEGLEFIILEIINENLESVLMGSKWYQMVIMGSHVNDKIIVEV